MLMSLVRSRPGLGGNYIGRASLALAHKSYVFSTLRLHTT